MLSPKNPKKLAVAEGLVVVSLDVMADDFGHFPGFIFNELDAEAPIALKSECILAQRNEPVLRAAIPLVIQTSFTK